MACYRVVPGGVMLAVRLTPRAARDVVDGVGRLSDGREVAVAHIRAVPAEGAANKSLLALIARTLDVPKSAVSIVAGGAARLKQVKVEGDVGTLSAMIGTWPRLS
jgi:uncharacterized protein YggU (UPF0235/DUF167 family)